MFRQLTSEQEESEIVLSDNKEDDAEKKDGTPLLSEALHNIALEFRCEDTTPSQRKLCTDFWRKLDRHPEFDRVMARGWLECTEVGVESKSALRSLSRTPCDDLREFVDRHIDDMVFPSMKQDTAICDVNKDLETSSANQLLDDLEQFDSTLQTEHTAPPKSPTRHKNNKKKHSTNSEQ
ncbi:uncharacterized protein LOC124356005 isoform X2 [Homalodisca vitripennis]|uniref:uncharacterized protein LOC124356005 isoform X2 n=1 Tax=Homalodisca vitripennis TaxID=197043 RepID=UPI001EEC0F8F|nr:uncharacterized protein LOC124356005 isoform X2 [Homalodisca vitripennis]